MLSLSADELVALQQTTRNEIDGVVDRAFGLAAAAGLPTLSLTDGPIEVAKWLFAFHALQGTVVLEPLLSVWRHYGLSGGNDGQYGDSGFDSNRAEWGPNLWAHGGIAVGVGVVVVREPN